MATKVDVYRQACILAGLSIPVTDADDSEEVDILNEFYDPVIEAELEDHPYRFAMHHGELVYLDANGTDELTYRYNMPAGGSGIIGRYVKNVQVQGYEIDWDIFAEGGSAMVYTGQKDDASNIPVVFYTEDPGVAYWPAQFELIIASELAVRLSLGLTRNEQVKKEIEAEVARLRAMFRTGSAQQRRSEGQRIKGNRLTSGRRGRFSSSLT